VGGLIDGGAPVRTDFVVEPAGLQVDETRYLVAGGELDACTLDRPDRA